MLIIQNNATSIPYEPDRKAQSDATIGVKCMMTHAYSKEINEKEDDSIEPSSFSYEASFFTVRQRPGRLLHPEDQPVR